MSKEDYTFKRDAFLIVITTIICFSVAFVAGVAVEFFYKVI